MDQQNEGEMMDDRELQTLRNEGNLSEQAADEIERLRVLLAWAYGKLERFSFSKEQDALNMDEIKMLLEHGI